MTGVMSLINPLVSRVVERKELEHVTLVALELIRHVVSRLAMAPEMVTMTVTVTGNLQ